MLLDDVLAALDVHTAKHVVNEALRGDLTRDRTIILATHNIALTAPIAEHVILLGKNGKVLNYGPVSEVLKISPTLHAEVEERTEIMIDSATVVEPNANSEPQEAQSEATAGKLVVAEEKATGRLESGAIMLYVNAYGGIVTWLVTALMTMSTIAAFIAQPWFIGVWSSQYENHDPSEIQVAW